MADDIFQKMLDKLTAIFGKLSALKQTTVQTAQKASVLTKQSFANVAKTFGNLQKTFKNLKAGNLAGALKTGASVAQAVGGAAGASGAGLTAFGARLAAAAGPIGILVAVIGTVIAAFVKLVTTIYSMSKSFLEAKREISQWSAKLALSFAQSDIRDIMRNIKIANETADATARLNKAFSELEDRLAPFRIWLDNIKANLLATGVEFMNAALADVEKENEKTEKFGAFLRDIFNDFLNKWFRGMTDDEVGAERDRRQEEHDRAVAESKKAAANTHFNEFMTNLRQLKLADVQDKRPLLF